MIPEAEACLSYNLWTWIDPHPRVRDKDSTVLSHRSPCYQGLDKGHKNQCLQRLMMVNVYIFAMMTQSTKHSPQSV